MDQLKSKISEQLQRKGDKYLVGFYMEILKESRPDAYLIHTYGAHNEEDKGRDIVVTNSEGFAVEFVQVKHSLNVNKKITYSNFMNECGKTMLNIVLDQQEGLYLVDTNVKYIIACNHEVHKDIHDYNYKLNDDSIKCAKELFISAKKLDYKRFELVEYDDVRVSFEALVKKLTIDYYNHERMISEVIGSQRLLLYFDEVQINLTDYVDDHLDEINGESQYRFLEELNSINYFSPDHYYNDALNCFVLTNGIINNVGSLKISL